MQIKRNLFLTRAAHDYLLDNQRFALQCAFAVCAFCKWSLAGVRFADLPADLLAELTGALPDHLKAHARVYL